VDRGCVQSERLCGPDSLAALWHLQQWTRRHIRYVRGRRIDPVLHRRGAAAYGDTYDDCTYANVDPSAYADASAYADRHSHCYSSAYQHADRDTYCYGHGSAQQYAHCHCDSGANCDGGADRDAFSNTHRDNSADRDTHCYRSAYRISLR
jgi:hypothetical protein